MAAEGNSLPMSMTGKERSYIKQTRYTLTWESIGAWKVAGIVLFSVKAEACIVYLRFNLYFRRLYIGFIYTLSSLLLSINIRDGQKFPSYATRDIVVGIFSSFLYRSLFVRVIC